MSIAISRPMPRAAPVTTAALPLSMRSSPCEVRNARHDTTPPRAACLPALTRVERRHVRGAEREDDRGVVDEHHEGDEDAEGAVDLVVDADLADVETEELLGDLPQQRRQQRSRQGGAGARAPPRHVP